MHRTSWFWDGTICGMDDLELWPFMQLNPFTKITAPCKASPLSSGLSDPHLRAKLVHLSASVAIRLKHAIIGRNRCLASLQRLTISPNRRYHPWFVGRRDTHLFIRDPLLSWQQSCHREHCLISYDFTRHEIHLPSLEERLARLWLRSINELLASANSVSCHQVVMYTATSWSKYSIDVAHASVLQTADVQIETADGGV